MRLRFPRCFCWLRRVRGCAKCDRLVITGMAQGTVWHDARESDAGLLLYSGASGEPLTFLGWYARWLEGHT